MLPTSAIPFLRDDRRSHHCLNVFVAWSESHRLGLADSVSPEMS